MLSDLHLFLAEIAKMGLGLGELYFSHGSETLQVIGLPEVSNVLLVVGLSFQEFLEFARTAQEVHLRLSF